MEFVGGAGVWQRITELCEAVEDGERFVCVPYIQEGSFEGRLPLGPGDTLVTDCSPESAAHGVNNPHEVARYITAGVDVFQWDSLHAKVYVFGDRAIVGSANASASSAKTLDEAIVVARDKSTVRQAREFIESLCHPELLLDADQLVSWKPDPPINTV